MEYQIQAEQDFKYVEIGNPDGEVLLLLHGLFGALSNFESILKKFGDEYLISVPLLPIMDMPILKLGLTGLVDYVIRFVDHKGYQNMYVVGNSLGGHLTLMFALAHPNSILSLTLTGSSGLFENSLGSSFPKRGDYDFIKEKVQGTFYDPKMATKELVDEVFGIVNDRTRALRMVKTSKSAIRHNLSDQLHKIQAPTLLVWGSQDSITPPFVGEKFKDLIPHSKLVFIDHCGHAPMMERPEEFNEVLAAFLEDVKTGKANYL